MASGDHGCGFHEIRAPPQITIQAQKCDLDFHHAFRLDRGPCGLTEIPKTKSGWALRAYLVLIGYAYRGETITNGELLQAVECESPTALANSLDCLTRWCTGTNQPQIVSLVVEPTTGMPAPGFVAVARDAIPAEHEKIWAHDWFVYFPPTIDELAQEAGETLHFPSDQVWPGKV